MSSTARAGSPGFLKGGTAPSHRLVLGRMGPQTRVAPTLLLVLHKDE